MKLNEFDSVYLVFSRVLCILLVILSIAACLLSLGNRSVLLRMTTMREQVSWPIKRHSAVCVCIPFTTSTTNIIKSMIWAPDSKHTHQIKHDKIKSPRKHYRNRLRIRGERTIDFPFPLFLSIFLALILSWEIPFGGREEVKLEPPSALINHMCHKCTHTHTHTAMPSMQLHQTFPLQLSLFGPAGLKNPQDIISNYHPFLHTSLHDYNTYQIAYVGRQTMRATFLQYRGTSNAFTVKKYLS